MVADRILILDDNPARHRLFRAIYGARGAFHAHDVESFKRQLDDVMEGEAEPFSAIFLDHDLCSFHYGSDTHDEECGCAAATSLGLFYAGRKTKPPVVIHSRNSAAAFLMAKILILGGFTDVRHLPFE